MTRDFFFCEICLSCCMQGTRKRRVYEGTKWQSMEMDMDNKGGAKDKVLYVENGTRNNPNEEQIVGEGHP